ncbi:MAG: efflux RND transporter periplasmic adaptor subunit [Bacteroidales bacterium]
MKKKTLIIIAAVSVIGIVAILALKPFSKKEAAVAFNTVKVEKGDINNTVTATGTIQALKTVNVGTQVSGIILHIYVDFNDHVKQGQLLAKLDETPLRTQLDQSQSAVDQAQSQLHFQEATYNRLKVLYDKKLIAQNDYDQALYNFENSKAALSNAKSGLDRAKVNLEYATITSPIDGVVLNRAIEEGQTVAASFSTPTLFTIVNDLTQMEVQTSVDEADIGKVKECQRVQFTVDAYSDLKFEGTVSQVRLQPVTTNNVVTYVVILNAPNPDKKLMPGMTASATIYVEEKTNTLLLSGKAVRFTPDQAYMMKMFAKMKANGSMPKMPAGAPSGSGGIAQNIPAGQSFQGMPSPAGMAGINADPKTKTVWLKDEKMGIRPSMVKIGIDNGTSVEILSGLKEGDEVVISSGDEEVKSSAKKTDNGPPGFPF